MTTASEESWDLDALISEFQRQRAQNAFLSIDDFIKDYPEFADDLYSILPTVTALDSLNSFQQHRALSVADFPKVLGDFDLIEKIGQGGMGSVFKARQKSLKRLVALKVLLPAWSEDPKLRAKFENEAQLVAQLNHPHILHVYESGHDHAHMYYVMELLDCEGLNKIDIPRRFPNCTRAQAVATLGVQAADALTYAHRHGILHRDIKPSNLLVDQQGELFVSDFGLATLLREDENASFLTHTQSGTLHYMPPERLTRNENLFASDQYSLGLSLYEVYTGKPALTEKNPGALIRRICEAPIPPLNSGDKDFDTIINKCIHFNPQDRYVSMDDMARDLRRYLNHEPILARPVSIPHRFFLWCKRKPGIAFLTLLACLLTFVSFFTFYVGYILLSHALKDESTQRQLAEEKFDFADRLLEQNLNQLIPPSFFLSDSFPISSHSAQLLQLSRDYYRKIVDFQASDIDRTCTYLQLGSIELALGNYTAAIDALRLASDMQNKTSISEISITTHNLLGLAYARSSDTKRAEDDWRWVAEITQKSETQFFKIAYAKSLYFQINYVQKSPELITRLAATLVRILEQDSSCVEARFMAMTPDIQSVYEAISLDSHSVRLFE